MKKDAKSPATTCDQYDHMLPAWDKIQTVLDGTRAMRESGPLHLPQHDKESDDAYLERLHRCTLFNMTKLTLNAWVGQPFSEPIMFDENVPQEILDLQDDIDTLGSSVQVFSRNWFKEGMAKAYAHVLVDMPRLDERADGKPRTMEDDRVDGVRPYWVLIKPEQLFFAEAKTVAGKEQLQEIRYIEIETKRDGFAICREEQIKRLYLDDGVVQVEVWQEVKSKTKKKVWRIVDSWTMDIDTIPLVTFYADREAFMLGTPPVEDLADLNIAHWQSTSDQRAVITVARFPILACSGGTDETNKLVVGPNRWLYTPDSSGKFYYVEHSGKAIDAGLKDLLELTRQMSEYGAEWLKKRNDRETATARKLDSAEATSALQDATLRFQDAMQTVMQLTAYWLNLDDGGTVIIHNQFSAPPVSEEGLRVLIEARKNRDLSREAFIAELKRAGLLDEKFDVEEDGAILESELMDLFPMPVPNDPNAEEENDAKDEQEEGDENEEA